MAAKVLMGFLMLVVFWVTGTWLVSYSVHWSWTDVQLAFALSLFLGSFVAIPALLYLLIADSLANKVAFPWSAILYVGLVALGFVLAGAVWVYGLGPPIRQPSDSWHALKRLFIFPALAMASVPLIWRIVRALPAR